MSIIIGLLIFYLLMGILVASSEHKIVFHEDTFPSVWRHRRQVVRWILIWPKLAFIISR